MAKKSTPNTGSFYLPEIYGGMAPSQSKAPTSTDSVYGGAAVGSRSGAFGEGAGTSSSDTYSKGGVTPTAEQIAYGAARAGGQNPMSGSEIAADFKKTQEAAKNVAVGLAQPFIRPGAQVIAPIAEKFVNSPIIKDFTGTPENKDFKFPDVEYRGQSLYKQNYTTGDALTDAAWIAASTVPWVKGSKAVAGAAKSASTAAKGKKLVSEAEDVLRNAAKNTPDAKPPSGGAPSVNPPKPPTSPSVTKSDIAANKYGKVAGETSSGSGISSSSTTPTTASYTQGQQFAQAANRSSSALGEATRTMGVNESTVVPKTVTAVAPKPAKPPTPPSIKNVGAVNPFVEAAGAASSAAAAASSVSRTAAGAAAGTTGAVIRGIANQSSSSTPPSNVGPQFITRSGLEVWGQRNTSNPPPSPDRGRPELKIDNTPKVGGPAPAKGPASPVKDPSTPVKEPIKDESRPPATEPIRDEFRYPSKPPHGGTPEVPPKIDDPLPPKDEPTARNKPKLPIAGANLKSPTDFAKIPYIP